MDAINTLVQQLFREDEVPLSPKQPPPNPALREEEKSPLVRSALGGDVVERAHHHHREGSLGNARTVEQYEGRVDETGVEAAARRLDELELESARRKAREEEQAAINSATRRALKYATVPLETARERAKAIAMGLEYKGDEEG